MKHCLTPSSEPKNSEDSGSRAATIQYVMPAVWTLSTQLQVAQEGRAGDHQVSQNVMQRSPNAAYPAEKTGVTGERQHSKR